MGHDDTALLVTPIPQCPSSDGFPTAQCLRPAGISGTQDFFCESDQSHQMSRLQVLTIKNEFPAINLEFLSKSNLRNSQDGGGEGGLGNKKQIPLFLPSPLSLNISFKE